MPTIIESYANACGVKLRDTHKFPPAFYPVPDKYIAIYTGGEAESQLYDYYNDAIFILSGQINQKGYSIVQIGEPQDQGINGAIDYRGILSPYQISYIISKSKLFICNDSWYCYIASLNNVPVITPFGPNYSNVSRPFFHNPKSFFIEPNRGEKRASFSSHEQSKSINSIKPEEIAFHACNILDFKEPNIKTLFVGSRYHESIFEVIPDHLVDPSDLQDVPLTFRYDLYQNESYLIHNSNFRKCFIRTDRPIPQYVFENRIERFSIFYDITNGYDKRFIDFLHSNNIEYYIICDSSANDISKTKFDLFEYNEVIMQDISDARKVEGIKITPNTYVKTNKLILSMGSAYLTSWHYKCRISIEQEKTIGKAIDSDEFWENSDFFWLFSNKR